VQQDQQYEGDFYDSVEIGASLAPFSQGSTFPIFKSQTGVSGGNKDLAFTNITQTKRIPSYAKLKLQRIGVHVRQWVGTARPSPEDVIAVYELTTLRFTLGQTNLIAEGPLLTFQSGLGVTGVTTANNFSALTLGVASQAAAPRLREESDINDKIDLNASITVSSNQFLASDNTLPALVGNGAATHIIASVFLHGIITRPLGS
jgi:hypothetical protein